MNRHPAYHGNNLIAKKMSITVQYTQAALEGDQEEMDLLAHEAEVVETELEYWKQAALKRKA